VVGPEHATGAASPRNGFSTVASAAAPKAPPKILSAPRRDVGRPIARLRSSNRSLIPQPSSYGFAGPRTRCVHHDPFRTFALADGRALLEPALEPRRTRRSSRHVLSESPIRAPTTGGQRVPASVGNPSHVVSHGRGVRQRETPPQRSRRDDLRAREAFRGTPARACVRLARPSHPRHGHCAPVDSAESTGQAPARLRLSHASRLEPEK
jgi:hypothetical protein